jgi:hypothetical protein
MQFVSRAPWLCVAAALLVGCSMDPEQRLIGKWKADSSAAGVAMKAAKMKADNPEISGSDAMAYARSLTKVSLDLNKDKSCTLVTGGNTLKGTWKFDKEASLVELDLKTAEIAEENKAKNPEGFKPQTFVVVVEDGGDKLEVLPMPRESYEMVKEATKGKKRQKFMVLRKSG